ncbi:MAG TPA: hypothetical protein VF749_11520 [Candidatus Acidoferrum sp.]
MGRPLDKKEAVLYGRLINAAYAMFERAPADAHPLPAAGEIPEPYELVAWINMSDFVFWWREKPKFYGLIARNQEQKHDFVLAIRGTEGWVEWLDDAVARLVQFRQVGNTGQVEHGFDKIYGTLRVVKRHGASGVPAAKAAAAPAAREEAAPSFAELVEQLADTLEEPEVMRMAKERRPRRSFVVTGHSPRFRVGYFVCGGEQGEKQVRHLNGLYLRVAASGERRVREPVQWFRCAFRSLTTSMLRRSMNFPPAAK